VKPKIKKLMHWVYWMVDKLVWQLSLGTIDCRRLNVKVDGNSNIVLKSLLASE